MWRVKGFFVLFFTDSMVVNLSDDEPEPKTKPQRGKETIIEVYFIYSHNGSFCIHNTTKSGQKKKKEKQKKLNVHLVNDVRWMGRAGLRAVLPLFWAVFNHRLLRLLPAYYVGVSM